MDAHSALYCSICCGRVFRHRNTAPMLQVHLVPQGLGCRNCGLALDGRARLTNTCICWSNRAVCEGGGGGGILQPDGRPSGSYQVLLGKHGRPAGAPLRVRAPGYHRHSASAHTSSSPVDATAACRCKQASRPCRPGVTPLPAGPVRFAEGYNGCSRQWSCSKQWGAAWHARLP